MGIVNQEVTIINDILKDFGDKINSLNLLASVELDKQFERRDGGFQP